MHPETTANRLYRIEVILLTSISAAVFSGLLFFCLGAFRGEKSTSEGITTWYHGQPQFLCGSAVGLLGVAFFFASCWFNFVVPTKNMPLNFRTAVLYFPRIFVHITFGFAGLSCLGGWFLFYQGDCDWIRIDHDQVTSGFLVPTRSMKFDQMKEVNFTEVRTKHKEKNGTVSYRYSPTVDFELISSKKITWPGVPMINVEQEFQQMLKLREIPYSSRRSQTYLSEKKESSNAIQAGSISAATPAASISTADYIAQMRQMRVKTDLEEIVGSRWRYFSDFPVRVDEMIIEFRSDMTGTIQVKKEFREKDPQTVIDTQITFELVYEPYRGATALHITLSDRSTINAILSVEEGEARFFSLRANGPLAEKVARFFVYRNRFKRQQLNPASAK